MKWRFPKFRSKEKEIRSILNEYHFQHKDIGDLNQITNTDYFIISMPKCGTTSLKNGFIELDKPTIHTHTNEVGFNFLSNGNILKDKDLGMEVFIQYRLKTRDGEIYLFSGFRDFISWYISLSQQFNLKLDNQLIDEFEQNLLYRKPWKDYLPELQFNLIKKCTGLDILNLSFDKEEGISIYKKDRINLVLYRIDALSKVEKYIKREINYEYKIVNGRVNQTKPYTQFKKKMKLKRELLDNIFENKFITHFYSDKSIEAIKDKYAIA